MTVKTTHPSERKRIQQQVVVSSANGLPVDSVVKIEGPRQIIADTAEPLVNYTSPVVTVSGTYDLEPVKRNESKYTGSNIFIDSAGNTYFIKRTSINVAAGTFEIYNEPDFLTSPAMVSNEPGWIIAEAKLTNKLSVSTEAKIDQVVFNGFDVQFNLDGSEDSIRIVDSDGDELDINPDGSIDANITVDASDGDNIAISSHEVPYKYTNETNRLKADLTLGTFEELFVLPVTLADTRIHIIKVKADTFGLFRVRVNGDVEDYYRTSPTKRNCIFEFSEDIRVNPGDTVSVEFTPDRNRLNDYNFFVRAEGYIQA